MVWHAHCFKLGWLTEITEDTADGGVMRKRKTVVLLLPVFSIFIVLALINGLALADIRTVKGAGTLTSVEDDGTAIIDEKGYQVDPSATIINRAGRPAPLRGLSLPANVRFEYVYTQTGFLIVHIEEIRDRASEKRRQR